MKCDRKVVYLTILKPEWLKLTGTSYIWWKWGKRLVKYCLVNFYWLQCPSKEETNGYKIVIRTKQGIIRKDRFLKFLKIRMGIMDWKSPKKKVKNRKIQIHTVEVNWGRKINPILDNGWKYVHLNVRNNIKITNGY